MATGTRAIAIGELVWDLLPDGEVLGGSPINLIYGLHCLGQPAAAVTAVGEDRLGRRALRQLRRLGLSTRSVQTSELPTGTVDVSLNEQGEPTFHIHENTAWDSLVWGPELEELADSAGAVCFSTLGQRSAPSRRTIRRFLEAAPESALRVLDINLRPPYYDADLIQASLQRAGVVKLSDPELDTVSRLLGIRAGSPRARLAELLDAFELELICLTRGARGSLLLTGDEACEHPGFQVEVADTVGTGDAFLATLVYYLLRGASLETISRAANRLGSWVASQPGATPPQLGDEARRIIREEEANAK